MLRMAKLVAISIEAYSQDDLIQRFESVFKVFQQDADIEDSFMLDCSSNDLIQSCYFEFSRENGESSIFATSKCKSAN